MPALNIAIHFIAFNPTPYVNLLWVHLFTGSFECRVNLEAFGNSATSFPQTAVVMIPDVDNFVRFQIIMGKVKQCLFLHLLTF